MTTPQTFNKGFPSFPTLSDSIAKCRRLSASANAFQMTDSQIVQYMQSFYLYDMPAKFRSLKLKDKYTFTTNVGQDTYPFDSEHYITVEMPCYCMKRELKLVTNPWEFYGVNFNWQQLTNFAVGNGTTGPYSGRATAIPLLASTNNDPGPRLNPSLYFPQSRNQNILITANASPLAHGVGNTQNVTDDGLGNLIQIFETTGAQVQFGPSYYRTYASVDPFIPTASIDYETGQISGLYFDQAIPQGTPIQLQYNPQRLSIPLSIMFYQNQFTLRPVPDQGYTIELQAYRQPIQALLAATQDGNPELSEWWEILSIGAAKKIYEDRLDSDGIQFMDKMLREKYALIETRTYAQIGQESVRTIYSDQLNYNYGMGQGWFGSV